MPQLLVKYVVSGGKYVTKVAGAVPNELNGLVVSLPPEMASVEPVPEPPGSTQVVTSVITVGVETLSTWPVKLMYCPVYGDVAEKNLNKAVGDVERPYIPVAVVKVVGLAEPPLLVVPVYAVPAIVLDDPAPVIKIAPA